MVDRAWIGCIVMLLAGPLAACGEDSPGSAEGQTSCHSVMHIGDSLTVGMMAEGQIPDPALRLDGQYRAVGVADVHGDGGVGRTIHEVSNNEQPGAEVARDARANGYSGCWVVELGTNDVALLAQNRPPSAPASGSTR